MTSTLFVVVTSYWKAQRQQQWPRKELEAYKNKTPEMSETIIVNSKEEEAVYGLCHLEGIERENVQGTAMRRPSGQHEDPRAVHTAFLRTVV